LCNCGTRWKELKFVSRNNYQFGEEEKEQYNKFKKESRELVITIENTCTSNNTQTIVTSEVTVNEKKEKDSLYFQNQNHDYYIIRIYIM
jgi:hypothetical protein